MKRQGFSLLEGMVATALLVVAATISLEILVLNTTASREADQRRLATREAANVMERLMARPHDELTPDAVKGVQLGEETTKSLAKAQLDIRLDEQADDGPPATRVTVTVTWQGRGERPAKPVRLVAWRYDAEEATP